MHSCVCVMCFEKSRHGPLQKQQRLRQHAPSQRSLRQSCLGTNCEALWPLSSRQSCFSGAWIEVAVGSRHGGARHSTSCAPAKPHHAANNGSVVGRSAVLLRSETSLMFVTLVANTDIENGPADGATGGVVSWSPETSVDGTSVRSMRASEAGVLVPQSFVSECQAIFPAQYRLYRHGAKKGSRLISQGQTFDAAAALPTCILLNHPQSSSFHDSARRPWMPGGRLCPWSNLRAWGPGSKPETVQNNWDNPDLLNDVAKAWAAASLDVDSCLDAAAVVTGQWCYTHALLGTEPCCNVRARLRNVREEEA